MSPLLHKCISFIIAAMLFFEVAVIFGRSIQYMSRIWREQSQPSATYVDFFDPCKKIDATNLSLIEQEHLKKYRTVGSLCAE